MSLLKERTTTMIMNDDMVKVYDGILRSIFGNERVTVPVKYGYGYTDRKWSSERIEFCPSAEDTYDGIGFIEMEPIRVSLDEIFFMTVGETAGKKELIVRRKDGAEFRVNF